jgi:hypothetical protein
MDSKKKSRFVSGPPTPSTARPTVNRLTFKYRGHTHIYFYDDADILDAVKIVSVHSQEGLLPPGAGRVLVSCILGGEDE